MKKFVSMILVAGLLLCVAAHSATVSTLIAASTNGGISVHPTSGDIYASELGPDPFNDTSNDRRIFRITPDGVPTLFANGFNGADGNDFDAGGNLYQINFSDGNVSKITPGGAVSTFASLSGKGPSVVLS